MSDDRISPPRLEWTPDELLARHIRDERLDAVQSEEDRLERLGLHTVAWGRYVGCTVRLTPAFTLFCAPPRIFQRKLRHLYARWELACRRVAELAAMRQGA